MKRFPPFFYKKEGLGYWEWGVPGGAYITIEPRPSYCDRGNWIAKVSGIPSLDTEDGFPRYYFDLHAAMSEMVAFLKKRKIYKSIP